MVNKNEIVGTNKINITSCYKNDNIKDWCDVEEQKNFKEIEKLGRC